MSIQIFKSDPLFFQRLMSSVGLYAGRLDGDWGPKTEAAAKEFNRLFNSYAKEYGTFDDRSEGVIETLIPKAQIAARMFLSRAKDSPYTVKLLSGTRTYAEQDVLFNRRPKVTNARGGQSNHNFGIAFDVGIFEGKTYFTGKNEKENDAYRSLPEIVKYKELGLDWGGDWKSFKDTPHYELTTGKTITEVRTLLEKGKPYVKMYLK